MSALLKRLRAVHRLDATPRPLQVVPSHSWQTAEKPTEGEKKRVVLQPNPRPAPIVSVKSMVDRYLSDVDDSVKEMVPTFRLRGPRSDGVFHASEISKEGMCKRRLAYCIYQAPQVRSEKIDARVRRIFDQGHFFHARMEQTIVNAVAMHGGQAWREIGHPPDHKKRSGTADVGFELSDFRYLVELKGVKKSSFAALGSDAEEDHIGQVNTYMGLSGVHASFVIYECKDNQEMLEYFYRFDPIRWAKTTTIADEVLGHVKAGTLPDKITEAEGCEGARCSYYAICKAKKSKVVWNPQPKKE